MALKRANFIVLLLSIALLVACSSETDTTDTTIETKQGPVGKQAQQQIQNEACKSIGEHSSKDQTTTLENEPDVVYVATPQDVVDRMLKLAKVTKDDVVYDLGCGDGRVVVTAAKRFGCRAVGYDIDSKRIKESRENVMRNGVQHLVRIEQKDIFTLDLKEANVVFLYLLPELNVKLIPQLEKLRPGSRIVSHDFDMEGIRPDAEECMDSKEDDDDHDIYLWTTPLKKEAAY